MIQKILYDILITSRKLRQYFDANNILVVSDFPLADILHNQDATGRISKWAVELRALTLDFKPRIAIKSQALVNFMAQWRDTKWKPQPTSQSIGSCTLMAHSSSVAVVQEYFSSAREENSSSTCFKYYSRSQTMKLNTRHYCTGYAWQSP
jgi:hypothetical protein